MAFFFHRNSAMKLNDIGRRRERPVERTAKAASPASGITLNKTMPAVTSNARISVESFRSAP